LCIIFELLNENLYELLKQNYFQGISLNSIRYIIKQILEAVYQLQRANLIHCDLKPENILLKIDKVNNKNDIIIKITDFGSACFQNNTMFEYIQSRYYRAPEVLVGSRYGPEIDMWSIGCIAAELYIGQPILPGSSEFDQLGKIVKLIGDVPEYIRKDSKNSRKYYIFDQHSKKHRIKTIGEYLKEFPNEPEPKYEIPLELSNLEELLIKNNKTNLNLSSNSLSSSYNDYNMESFINFLKGLLNPDPRQRWNAKQALRHPFITKEKFEGYFNPNTEETSQFLYRSIEVSQNSDRINYYIRKCPKSNMYHSMMYNINPYLSNNISCDHTTSFTNSSLETSCYQLNTNKIPLQMLKNFPYAKIEEINLKPIRGKEKCYNKFDNNTFMKTSYDQINQSFTSDHLLYGKKKRQVKDDLMTKDKNKFSKYSKVNEKSFGQNNNYNRNYFWMSTDHMNNKIDFNQRQGLQIQGVNDKITSSGNF
jgi:serine/threonine protein kinase